MATCVFRFAISQDRVTGKKERGREKVGFSSVNSPVSVRIIFWETPGRHLFVSLWPELVKSPLQDQWITIHPERWGIILSVSVLSLSSLSHTLSFFLCLGLILSYQKWTLPFEYWGRQRSWWGGDLASSGTTENSTASHSSRLTTLRKRVFSKQPYIQCQGQFWLTWVCTYFPDYHVSQGWLYLFLGMGGIALSVLLSYNYWLFVFKCRVIVLLFYFVLEYTCLTTLCCCTMLFLLHNKGNQLSIYIYPLPLEPPSHPQL